MYWKPYLVSFILLQTYRYTPRHYFGLWRMCIKCMEQYIIFYYIILYILLYYIVLRRVPPAPFKGIKSPLCIVNFHGDMWCYNLFYLLHCLFVLYVSFWTLDGFFFWLVWLVFLFVLSLVCALFVFSVLWTAILCQSFLLICLLVWLHILLVFFSPLPSLSFLWQSFHLVGHVVTFWPVWPVRGHV